VRRAALFPLILLIGLVGGALTAGAIAGGPPGPAVGALGVSPGPFSAVVGWNLDTAGSVVVEYGVDDRYGVWADPVRREQPGAGSVTLTGLEPATRYRFRLTGVPVKCCHRICCRHSAAASSDAEFCQALGVVEPKK
jgi:hypothetical protein